MAHRDLEDLANRNDQLSEQTVLAVKEMLSVPLNQLEDINAEMRRCEEKGAEIEKLIEPYSRLLTPIRRVPQDVLDTIFEHCLMTHRNPTMDATEAPVLLTQACSN